jgi:hypothetical protein
MSKFWDLLSEDHEKRIVGQDMNDFRKFLSIDYSASELYENDHWLLEIYNKMRGMKIDFFEDKMVGNPHYTEVNGFKITQDLLHSCWEVDTLKNNLNMNEIKTIVEFGGGSGRTAEAIKTFFPHIKYTIIDIEPALTVSRWYLEQVGITGVEFREELPPTKADLYIAISVFSELEQQEVSAYMATVRTGIWFYLKDWQHVKNDHNNVDAYRDHYSIPGWRTLIDREYPLYPGFFEALYKIE